MFTSNTVKKKKKNTVLNAKKWYVKYITLQLLRQSSFTLKYQVKYLINIVSTKYA